MGNSNDEMLKKVYGGNCNIEADTGRCRKRKADTVRKRQIKNRQIKGK